MYSPYFSRQTYIYIFFKRIWRCWSILQYWIETPQLILNHIGFMWFSHVSQDSGVFFNFQGHASASVAEIAAGAGALGTGSGCSDDERCELLMSQQHQQWMISISSRFISWSLLDYYMRYTTVEYQGFCISADWGSVYQRELQRYSFHGIHESMKLPWCEFSGNLLGQLAEEISLAATVSEAEKTQRFSRIQSGQHFESIHIRIYIYTYIYIHIYIHIYIYTYIYISIS